MPSDSPEVVEFMASFGALRQQIGDDPSRLNAMAREDAVFRELCLRTRDAHFFLDYLTQSRRHAFAAPVNPAFVRTWRDYEANYNALIAPFAAAALGLGDAHEPQAEAPVRPDLRAKFDVADEEAERLLAGIMDALDLAANELESNEFISAEQAWSVQEGIDAWSALNRTVGFDVRGAFRRRRLLSLILIPRHVANKHGSAEAISLYSYLREAQDAYIRGTLYACLVLMRSVVELVLRDHYGMKKIQNGKDRQGLEEKIKQCDRLPDRAKKERLIRLKDFADGYVHSNPDRWSQIPSMTNIELEIELLSFLNALQALIEEAPE